jgi:hypothetical protein
MDEDLDTMTRERLIEEVLELRRAIRKHRDASLHELCWHHPALWGLLPDMLTGRPGGTQLAAGVSSIAPAARSARYCSARAAKAGVNDGSSASNAPPRVISQSPPQSGSTASDA